MTDPVLVPRRSPTGVFATWAAGFVVAVAIGVFVPPPLRAGWFGAGAGLVLVLAFAVNLWLGEARGFIVRVAASAVGAVAIMGAVSCVVALSSLAP